LMGDRYINPLNLFSLVPFKLPNQFLIFRQKIHENQK
jgi:hypothetical protein